MGTCCPRVRTRPPKNQPQNRFMQKFILLRGHEGSGKSVFAQAKIAEFLRAYPDAEIVHIDNDLALTDAAGRYRFDFAAFAQAHRSNMEKQAAAFTRGRQNPQRAMLVINANPNQKAKTCRLFLEAARAHGFATEVFRLHNSFPNLHGVPEADVCQSRARLDANPVDGEIHVPPIRI